MQAVRYNNFNIEKLEDGIRKTEKMWINKHDVSSELWKALQDHEEVYMRSYCDKEFCDKSKHKDLYFFNP